MFKMLFKLSICLFLAFAHYLSAKQLLCGPKQAWLAQTDGWTRKAHGSSRGWPMCPIGKLLFGYSNRQAFVWLYWFWMLVCSILMGLLARRAKRLYASIFLLIAVLRCVWAAAGAFFGPFGPKGRKAVRGTLFLGFWWIGMDLDGFGWIWMDLNENRGKSKRI